MKGRSDDYQWYVGQSVCQIPFKPSLLQQLQTEGAFAIQMKVQMNLDP